MKELFDYPSAIQSDEALGEVRRIRSFLYKMVEKLNLLLFDSGEQSNADMDTLNGRVKKLEDERELYAAPKKLLWTNSHPTEEFAAGTVLPINLAKYSMLYIECLYNSANGLAANRTVTVGAVPLDLPQNFNADANARRNACFVPYTPSGANNYLASRRYMMSRIGLKWDAGIATRFTAYNDGDQYCVPLRIWGE